MWISTFLFIIILGYIRALFIDFDTISHYIPIFTLFYLLWYISTNITSNLINKHNDIIKGGHFFI